MFGRRWWLCSPRRMVVLAALVTGCVLFFNRGDPSNNAYAHLPLNQQGLPEPYFPAPFAAHHEGMRRQALELQNTPQAQEEAKIGFERNSFNQFVSDRIPLDRQFKDMRPKECFNQRYHPHFALPSTSIIIIFHNEAVSTLLRTVWSAINHSPPELVEEILLVDDASTGEWLHIPEFEMAVASVPKTRIIRLPERSGLIRAKVAGAREAKGEVLTFLDSHCECNPGWLVPLLDRIRLDPTNVVAPIIDVISDKTFEYLPAASDLSRGVFSWYLVFGWRELPQSSQRLMSSKVEPYESPAMAGGLFSINRQYFFDIGTYDMGMEVWGGENIEMSFRIWMCGGRIENVPCSRVGHVFRSTNPVKFTNNDPSTTITKNLNRVADVWMDEFADIYRSLNALDPNQAKTDVSDRLALRKHLKCKSFDWYLQRVYPDMFVPIEKNVHHMGIIQNVATKLCLDTKAGSYDDIKQVKLGACVIPESDDISRRRFSHNQFFFFTKHPANTIRKVEMHTDKCIVVVPDESPDGEHKPDILWLQQCTDTKGEEWTYLETGQLYHRQSNQCAEVRSDGEESFSVVARECKRSNPRQRWGFMDSKVLS